MSNQDRFMDDMHFCVEVLGLDDDAIQEMYDQIKKFNVYSYQKREILLTCSDYMTQTTLTSRN